MDIVEKETRSRMMAAVKGRNTRYEVEIRKRLFFKGFRYRIDDRKLPGRPDIVLPKHKVIIFVNGCFWHYHECHLSRIPKSRSEWWREKLEGNRHRDVRNLEALATLKPLAFVMENVRKIGKHVGKNIAEEIAVTADAMGWYDLQLASRR